MSVFFVCNIIWSVALFFLLQTERDGANQKGGATTRGKLSLVGARGAQKKGTGMPQGTFYPSLHSL